MAWLGLRRGKKRMQAVHEQVGFKRTLFFCIYSELGAAARAELCSLRRLTGPILLFRVLCGSVAARPRPVADKELTFRLSVSVLCFLFTRVSVHIGVCLDGFCFAV